ncbi:MAG: M48 family metallopeptidase [Proteobacteria bacterium]|nr:M48 family metallopeptidase [Pseudomonadota bacterium]
MKQQILVLGILSSAILAATVACVTSQETGRSQLNLVSDSQMNALGEEAYKEILGKSKLAKDPKLNAEILLIGRKIAQAAAVGYEWEFNVIDEPETVNAFCLPGGKVAVYTGIVPIAKNNAGLAAVLGHEVAHAVLRHSAERTSQQMVLQMGLAASSLSFQNSKHRDTIAALLGVGAQFGLVLPFSRFQESEADRIGTEFMARAGYDPREAVSLWERMGAQNGRTLEILSTHPDPIRRARELNQHMPKALSLYQGSMIKESTKAL